MLQVLFFCFTEPKKPYIIEMQPPVDKLTGTLGRLSRLKMVILDHQKHTAGGRKKSEVKK